MNTDPAPPLKHVYAALLAVPDLNPLEAMLLTEIDLLSRAKGYCWKSNRAFARDYGLGVRWVQACFQSLRKRGYLRVAVKEGNKRKLGVTRKLLTHVGSELGGMSDPTPPPSPMGKVKNNPNAPARAGRAGLGVEEAKTKAKQLSNYFLKKAIVARFLVGTHPSNKAKWEQAALELLSSQPAKRIREVVDWYFENLRDPYTPNIRSLPVFAERFMDVEKAMIRKDPSRKRSKTSRRKVQLSTGEWRWVTSYEEE